MESEFFSLAVALGLPEAPTTPQTGPALPFPSSYSHLCLSDVIRAAHEKDVLKCNSAIKSDKYFLL